MHLLKRSGLILFAVSLFLKATAQVPVYLEPDIAENPLKTVSQEFLDKQESRQVLDAEKAAQGWKWIDLPGTYTGYVEKEKVTKALTVQPSTIVFSAPDPDSTVLTVLQDTDEHTLEASSGDWAEVTFTSSISVYFLDTVIVAPVSDGLNAPIAEQEDAPPPPPAPEPIPEDETIEELDIFSTDEVEPTDLRPELTTQFKPPTDILIAYSGVLSISKKKWLRSKPKTSTELRTLDGKKRIAWLNLENCVLHRSLNELHGKTVTVDAVAIEGNWGDDVVLDVRNIRVLLP